MKTKILFIFFFCIITLFGCKDKTKVSSVTSLDSVKRVTQRLTEQLAEDQSEGLMIIERLSRLYGENPNLIGGFLESPDCPGFLEGMYFDGPTLVFQVTGDTLQARRELEKDGGSKNFRIEPTGGSNYSQKQLLAIYNELGRKLEMVGEGSLRKNVTGFGVGLHHVEIHLMVNTLEKRKEFRGKVMDSPAFQFNGVEVPAVNAKKGTSDTLGIRIRPQYPFYPTETVQAKFILSNNSGGDLICGAHYYITFEDEKGTWRELPANGFFEDIAYIVQDKKERVIQASLYPDVHSNKPGRYRFFYQVTKDKTPLLMMAEFRLTNNEKER